MQYVNLVFKLSNHYIKTTLIEKTSCEESSIGKAIDVDVVLKGDLTIISPMRFHNFLDWYIRPFALHAVLFTVECNGLNLKTIEITHDC